MAKAETHAIKALATLVALSQFKGQRNRSSLHLCAGAVDQLAEFFATRDARRNNRRRPRGSDVVPLLIASKMLGLYEREKAAQPSPEWIARIVKASMY